MCACVCISVCLCILVHCAFVDVFVHVNLCVCVCVFMFYRAFTQQHIWSAQRALSQFTPFTMKVLVDKKKSFHSKMAKR